MRGTVELIGMQFFAYHGCLESERLQGNNFTVDFSADYDIAPAAEGDDLTKAADYGKVYTIIAERMKQPSNLLETVAADMVRMIEAEFPQLTAVKVKVSKQNPPVDGPTEWSSITAYGSR